MTKIVISDRDRAEARRVFEENFLPKKSNEEIFYHLLFCICVPQTTFKNCSEVISRLKKVRYYNFTTNKFYLEGTKREFLWKIIKPARFYKRKTEYVIEAREIFPLVIQMLEANQYVWSLNNFEKREWLVRNVKGLGMKTASHFLRNLGAMDLAIIDTHILKYLKVKDRKWDYLELEKRLQQKAKKLGMTVGEFDVILWKYYSKTDWRDYIY